MRSGTEVRVAVIGRYVTLVTFIYYMFYSPPAGFGSLTGSLTN